jgi:hypothetical protein
MATAVAPTTMRMAMTRLMADRLGETVGEAFGT